MTAMITGRCLCGQVHYQCGAPAVIAGHCQCVDCRKSSGTGHCSHLAVPHAAVAMSGEVTIYAKAADSGNIVSRAFCTTCGSPIYSLNSANSELMFLRASCLDDMNLFQPQMVVYTSRGAPWDTIDPALPRFETMPPMAPVQGV
jgi:hypothetical protein